jgi:membrane associated rhomboid family serine protease
MGIYDRDYYQEERPGLRLGGPRLMVTNLVIINVAIWLVDIVFFSQTHELSRSLSLKPGLFYEHWHVWELLTYGFAHDPKGILHVLFNMFVLWFFGRDVEGIYGKQKFLMFYLTAIILSGLIGEYVEPILKGRPALLLGASGGVVAVLILYIFHFPRRTLLFWGVFPMPAWVLGMICIGMDVIEAFKPDSNIANSAHLAGAAYGFLFFRTQWSLGNLLPANLSLKSFKRSPKFRIHDPGHDEALTAEVDRILEKISREGESSLTRKERRTLEAASRHFKQRR